MGAPKTIVGGQHTDERGTLCFINDFDMTPVKRFYTISHPDTSIIRGWRGHKIEQRWFHVSRGSFEIKLVQIDDWVKPNRNLTQDVFILTSEESTVLHVPVGFASSLRAFEPDSKLIVFADTDIQNTQHDDYLFPVDYFNQEN